MHITFLAPELSTTFRTVLICMKVLCCCKKADIFFFFSKESYQCLYVRTKNGFVTH
jgi:hypothetical protein